MKFIHKYIGDKAFYKMLFVLVFPLIIQQGVTNLVNLLDNMMVGALGTAQMTSVAAVNQLIFVFSLTIFGGISGASIFGAQFAGVGDDKGLRETFRFKMYFSIAVTALAMTVFWLWGDRLVMLFFNNEANRDLDLSVLLGYTRDYFGVMLLGLLPFAVVQAYAGTLRETGETFVPMVASVTAIFVNLGFNYLLIFGHFGFPQLGVRGAAIATVLSRYVELLIVVLYTHLRSSRFGFIRGAYRSFYVPAHLVRDIAKTGSPLMFNEVLWSLAMTSITHSYSTLGMTAMAAANITSTAWNLFCIIMFAMGTAVSIIVGRELGRGNADGAKDLARKLLFVTFVVHIVMGALLVSCARLIPMLYNTEQIVKDTAATMLTFAGLMIPMHALVHCIYFVIRSGGKTVITFLFDCVFTWVVTASLAYLLCHFTSLPIAYVYLFVQLSDALKLFIGIVLLKRGSWANTVIPTGEKQQA